MLGVIDAARGYGLCVVPEETVSGCKKGVCLLTIVSANLCPPAVALRMAYTPELATAIAHSPWYLVNDASAVSETGELVLCGWKARPKGSMAACAIRR